MPFQILPLTDGGRARAASADLLGWLLGADRLFLRQGI
ncbi:hypothetical protein SAMN06295937_1002156 [Sphingopyxis flava]|uniref:Uncharacterized protein n=1 Tax=Sphingopyxis flava TaxID=1507287 RepID=A0A1T5A2X2_9SPHN|nr:hypothetical protein SAMN06295937_1002156 [Sphingopyxis flava]